MQGAYKLQARKLIWLKNNLGPGHCLVISTTLNLSLSLPLCFFLSPSFPLSLPLSLSFSFSLSVRWKRLKQVTWRLVSSIHMLRTHVRTLSEGERERWTITQKRREAYGSYVFCMCADLRSVLLLSVKSRSVRLSPCLEEERGGLSPSSAVSSEKAQRKRLHYPWCSLSNSSCWLEH